MPQERRRAPKAGMLPVPRGVPRVPPGRGVRPQLSPHPALLRGCIASTLQLPASTRARLLPFPCFFSFSYFFFFLSRIYRGRLTQRAHTHARSALTCICHSLHMDTFGHVTSIPQFASLFYFILPLVSSCQKKAEGGAVRKAFSL